MRKNITLIIASAIVSLIAIFIPQNVEARKGESTVGIMGGFTTKNSAPMAGIFFQYSFSEHVRLSPQLGCVFRHKDLDNFFVDLNVHFPFTVGGDKCSLYPLAGLSYTSWDNHTLADNATDDVSTRKTRLGLNLGGGFAIHATRTLQLKIELAYTLNKGYSTFSPMIGIGYTF